MIISKTPLRISFVGGGTDQQYFYKFIDGAVVSTTINKFIYLACNEKFDSGIRISYSKTENILNLKNIKHGIFRNTLKYLNIKDKIELVSVADVHSKGTGLGSSSAFTVGLLKALYSYKGKNISQNKIAEDACNIEINLCKSPIGKQDQYASAIGGINYFKFKKNEKVEIHPILISDLFIKKLFKNLIFFYTGGNRNTNKILKINNKIKYLDNNYKDLEKMANLASHLYKEFKNEDLSNFSDILRENWYLKKKTLSKVSNKYIDEIESVGISCGAKSFKLLGAGQSGFVMFFADPKYHELIEKSLYKLKKINFSFYSKGSTTTEI
jgi:D-glycero-alpha-D-manno-heptose-7-phosphate kinase